MTATTIELAADGGMRCPSCRSSDVVRARTANEQGTNFHQLSTGTIGIGGGGIGLASSTTEGQSRSITAIRLAPPKDPVDGKIATWLFGAVALFIFGIIGGMVGGTEGFVFVAILIGISMFLSLRSLKARSAAYPAELAAYERKWSCARCGTVGDQSDFGLADT